MFGFCEPALVADALLAADAAALSATALTSTAALSAAALALAAGFFSAAAASAAESAAFWRANRSRRMHAALACADASMLCTSRMSASASSYFSSDSYAKPRRIRALASRGARASTFVQSSTAAR